MVSAKAMVELADKNINNRHIAEIERVVTDAANNGDFFVKLWEGKPNSMDTQLIFTEQYDTEAFHHLSRLGYVIAHTEDAFDVVRLYIGWGFDTASSLRIAIKASEDSVVEQPKKEAPSGRDKARGFLGRKK